MKPGKPYVRLALFAALAGWPTILIAQAGEFAPDIQADEVAGNASTQALLTGDWWGLRDPAASAGVRFEPYLVIGWSKNVNGGLDTQGDAFRHLFSFNVTFDLATMLGWESGTVFVDFQNQNGQNGSDEVGDFQFVDNWDADGLTQIGELWFEYELGDGAVRVKIGKVDANYEFAYTELGWEFVHGSAGYPATNALMPTYPDPATSVNLFFYPDESTAIKFGVYDGALQEGFRTGSRGPGTFADAPADLYLIAEVERTWHLAAMPGRFAVGGWHHTGDFDRFDGGVESGTSGFHLVFEQMVWCEQPTGYNQTDFYAEGIGFFLQFDLADGAVMELDYHVGAGLTWRGMLVGRDDDVIGAAFSWVHFSDDPNAGFIDSSETAFEVFYKAQLTAAVSVQPYVQYIINPGGLGIDDAVNVGTRSVFLF